MSYGTGPYGITFWGGTPLLAPPVIREIGEFEFTVKAKIEGFAIRIEYSVPTPAEAPDWGRRLRILRKQGEWPQSWDDAGAQVLVDDVYPALSGDYWIEQTGLEAGTIYYYALFAQRIDGAWINDVKLNRGSAYPYDRWGAVDYMFGTLPRGFRSEDAAVGHLYQFLSILGALVDNIKTDAEHLLTLMEIDAIHDDLIQLLDKKLGWPTWHAAGGLQRRVETSQAVDLYKLLGREVSYEQMLEGISDWEATIVEGWRYVFFSNDRFGSKTPDMTDPDNIRLRGRIDDVLKYTNDGNGWHAVTGLGFFLEEILGISGPFTSETVDRVRELIEWGKASYVTYGMIMTPMTEESVSLASDVIEEWEELLTYLIDQLIEEFGWTTTDWTLFESNDAACTTTTLTDRVFHEDLEYL